MLNAFSVENYRAFAEKTTIELRPLTLLFGYNNAGKSALIRALALMVDSARANGRGVLDLSSEAARECDFDDLRCRASGREGISLGLSFQEGVKIEAEITEDPRSRRRIVTDLQIFQELREGKAASTIRAEWTPAGPFQRNPGYDISIGGASAGNIELSFTGLAPVEHGSFFEGGEQFERQKVISKELFKATGLIHAMELHFQWLGSLRRYPSRYTRYSGEPPTRMGPDGSGAAEVLAYDNLDRGALLTEVSGWYEKYFKRRLNIVPSSDQRFSVILEPIEPSAKQPVALADTGEGIAQVLPILVAAAMAKRGGPGDPWTLAFEQPELHLHPAVHAPLAEHLCQLAAESTPPRMLIETHSENFLLGVQIQIAKGLLPKEHVLVYWIKAQEDGTSYAERIEFEDDGNPRGFPDNVFNEDLDLATELLAARERVPG
jgi:predicted ATPase